MSRLATHGATFVAGTAVPGPRVVSPPVELSREIVTLVGSAEPATRRELVHTQYAGEQELGDVMELIDNTLSEPYSIFTYRYFINTWPTLCILTRSRKPNHEGFRMPLWPWLPGLGALLCGALAIYQAITVPAAGAITAGAAAVEATGAVDGPGPT